MVSIFKKMYVNIEKTNLKYIKFFEVKNYQFVRFTMLLMKNFTFSK